MQIKLALLKTHVVFPESFYVDHRSHHSSLEHLFTTLGYSLVDYIQQARSSSQSLDQQSHIARLSQMVGLCREPLHKPLHHRDANKELLTVYPSLPELLYQGKIHLFVFCIQTYWLTTVKIFRSYGNSFYFIFFISQRNLFLLNRFRF